jgi:hypothetical protein
MKTFYVQNGTVENCMQWWKYDNCGYTCDIKHARIFAKDELREIHFRQFAVWPKDYIDSLIEFHVDIQPVNLRRKIEL